ncbi:anaerobic C4-dicarboxylate transporter [Aggregatibacter actinomycetemcomitans]|uniref:anaerobic C4-dicarboxylate transporter n=1 Tax=Aggregatibacter actinomycetemcomitans TaxID=714 RepID=UPI00023FF1A9|nr:anaerobic C4-dicarboxylate transporter [Aggregatibacter actinomycetemcomitans]EHK90630.1 anaerobic C4-dicarboxylate transporter [Aggregatibacter actinomycetemcomitans RhAA1]KNE77678.1 C4-dicarboxylate ABC transporter [Aggregatibacter actinomycetemcomitans RhAA1]MBN6074169.1 anaerobic C4-dicarboxylate transporter [Aggregatibacter actinomycetemcomitans]MBN6075999.1 anaerobic C4-dicarboxylate transporter [Aggregatibacter actinomycetemcomitans]MBN6079631.1 anaerobic C4-dicarboxylate transporter
MSAMFLFQFAIVLLCILIGARVGGIGLGVFGGLGLTILSFGFGLKPAGLPIDVMFMIMAVVAAAAAMQAAGGLDYMIKIATNILRRNPKYITFMAPAVTWTFTLLAGTGHVAYSVLPVIAEVSRQNGIRPERPLSMAVIASQFAIVASPIAAAVVAVVAYLEPQGIHLGDVLIVTIPSTIIGLFLACIFVNKMGKELKDDPEYQRRLNDPKYAEAFNSTISSKELEISKTAKVSVSLFLFGALLVVLMGAVPSLRPVFDGKPMGMAHTIEIIMLTIGALIILTCKPDGTEITKGSVFHAGMRAVIAIFGIAWLGDTLMQAHLEEVKGMVRGLVETAPWTFAIALFILSVLVNSQGATVATLFPLGIALGIPPAVLIGVFVAVNGYFFIPNYGPIIASIDFDTTGTTRIGKYIFNHSFMLPGLLSMAFSLALGLLFANIFL